MFGSLFKSKKHSIADMIAEGAVIVDVRSKAEFANGHIRKSINIPLGDLESGMKRLDKNKPIITCCATGMRSGSAKRFLAAKGFTNVVNGGGWSGLRKYE